MNASIRKNPLTKNKSLNRLTLPGIVVAAMFACGPFMFATIGGRGLFLYLAILFALSILLQAFAFDKRHALSLTVNKEVNIIITPFLICLLWQLISFFWSPALSFASIYAYLKTMLFFLLLSLPRYSKADKKLMLVAQTAIIILATVVLLTQKETSSAGGAVTERLTFTFFGVEQDPNYLAFFYVGPFVTLLSVASDKCRHILARLGSITLLAFLTFGILSTGSRGALLGIVVATVIFLATKTTLRWWKFLSIIIGSALLAVVLFKSISQFLPESIADRFTLDHILESGGSGRTEIWERYITNLIKNPLYLLVGAGNSSCVSINYADAHNYFLESWFDFGIIGVAISIFFYFVFFRSVIKAKNHLSFTIIIGALVMAMFLSVNRMLPFWLCLTLANILHLPNKEELPRAKKKQASPLD